MWMLGIEPGSPSLQPQPVLFNDTEIQSLRSAVCFLKMALVQDGVSLSLYQWLGPSHSHTLGRLSLPMWFLQRHWDLHCSCLSFGVVFRGITMHSMLHLCYTRSAGPGNCVRSEDKPRTWQNDAQGVRIQYVALVK